MNRRETALLLAVLAFWAGCKHQDHQVTVEKRNAAEGGPRSEPRPAAAARPAPRPSSADGGARKELEQVQNERAMKIEELEKVDAELGTKREEMQKLSAPDAPADESTLDRLDKLAAEIDEHTRRKEALEGEIAAVESRERDLEARVGTPAPEPVAEAPAAPAPVAEAPAPAEPAPATAEPPADDPTALEIRMLEEERGRLTDPAAPQTPETERKLRDLGEKLSALYAERDAKAQPPAEPVAAAPPAPVEPAPAEPVAAAPTEPAAPAEPAVETPPAAPAPAEPVVETPPAPVEPAPVEPASAPAEPAAEAPAPAPAAPVAEAPAPAEPAPATEPPPADHSAEEAAARNAARKEAADAEWAKVVPEVESLAGEKKFAAAIARLRNFEATYPGSAHGKDAADSLQFILQAARGRVAELKSEADALTAEGKHEEAMTRLQEAKDLDDLASGRSASFRLAAGNESYYYEEVWGDVIRSVKAELEKHR